MSLLLEGLILGQPRQAERRHLDPMRHMQPAAPASPTQARGDGGVRSAPNGGAGEVSAGGGKSGPAAVSSGGFELQAMPNGARAGRVRER